MIIRNQRQRGVVAIELALLSSVIFLFMGGMLLFGRAFHQYATVQNAVANATLVAASAPPNIFGNDDVHGDLESARQLVGLAARRASLDQSAGRFNIDSLVCGDSDANCVAALPEVLPRGVEMKLDRQFLEPIFGAWTEKWQASGTDEAGIRIKTGFYAPYVGKDLVGAP